MSRPESVTCIRRIGRNKMQTWCGAPVLMFVFVDAEHAIDNHAEEGRLTTCPDCARKVAAAVLASVVG